MKKQNAKPLLYDVIRFEWCRECKDVSCLSFKGKTINLSDTHTEVTESLSAELLKERLRLFGHDNALEDYCTFLDCTPCGFFNAKDYSTESNRLKRKRVCPVLHNDSYDQFDSLCLGMQYMI